MNRFRQRIASDIPFAKDDAHRLLPVMIACLIGFAALLLSVGMSINHALEHQSRAVIGMLQVELPKNTAAAQLTAVTALLKQTPGVEEVTTLSTAQMEALLKPWLGTNFALGDLPVPVIMDIKTAVANQRSTVNVDALRHDLAKIDTNIRVDDRGPWVGQVATATTLVQALVIFVALLLVACVIGMIVLVAKTNLRLHFKAVSLLHMFGATDDYILRQFQWNGAWLAARGAMAGVLFAAMIFAAAVILSMRWHSPVLPEIGMSFTHAILFLTLPVFTALVSLIATRLTVQSMLQHMHLMLVLLDRDGVINRDAPAGINRIAEFEFMPRALEALAMLTKAGFTLAICTNQSAIAKGLLTVETLAEIHAYMCSKIEAAGGRISMINVAPDHPDHPTDRRKPGPGMLREALQHFAADPAKTPMVGDMLRDLEAAAAAGCPRILVRNGKGARLAAEGVPAHVAPVTICDDLYAAAVHICTEYR